MNFTRFALADVLLVAHQVHTDDRGHFFEAISTAALSAQLKRPITIAQVNVSTSKCGVLRGLHLQVAPMAQAKIVRCVAGEILDVAVDLRPQSPDFGQHVSVRLSGARAQSLWVPEGFAHGFVVLSAHAQVEYAVTAPWSAAHERRLNPFDASLGIDWPLPSGTAKFTMSKLDQTGEPLSAFR